MESREAWTHVPARLLSSLYTKDSNLLGEWEQTPFCVPEGADPASYSHISSVIPPWASSSHWSPLSPRTGWVLSPTAFVPALPYLVLHSPLLWHLFYLLHSAKYSVFRNGSFPFWAARRMRRFFRISPWGAGGVVGGKAHTSVRSPWNF